MDFTVTPPIQETPVGVDKGIKGLQLAMSTIPWLEKSYARAIRVAKAGDPATGLPERLEPMVYHQYGNHISMLPNGEGKAYSFFLQHDPISQKDGQYQCDVSQIVYGNMTAIDPTRDELFDHELLFDVIAVLTDEGIEVQKIYTDTKQVFEGFHLGGLQAQFLQHPFFGFRLRMTLYFDGPC